MNRLPRANSPGAESFSQSHRWNRPLPTRPSIWQRFTPAQLFVGSFLLLIALGTVGFMTLPGLGVEDVYVKVISHDHARVMEHMEVQEAIFPERATGLDLVRRLSSPSVLRFMHFGENFSVQEMALPAPWRGHTLPELQLRQRFQVSVISVHDLQAGGMIMPPDPDTPLKRSDTLVVAGRDEALQRVADLG